MSQELERVYTINLGKVLLSPDNQRAKRAINMVKEFARHHMKTEQIKIDEEVSHKIWQRGIRSPPRKIRVRMSKTDEGYILVSTYEEEIEEVKPAEEKKELPKKVKPKTEVKEIETVPEEVKEEVKEEKPKAKEPKVKEPKPKVTKTKEPKTKEVKTKESKPQEKPKETKQKETKKEPKAKESKTTKTTKPKKKSK